MRRFRRKAGCLLMALLLLPGGTDAAKLAPAQLVCLQTVDGEITVRTDLGNMGRGTDLEEAFADLENTTAGKVFLDTADYLLVDEGSMKYLPEAAEWLKGNCFVFRAGEVQDLESAAVYLDAHPVGVKLKECRTGNEDLPIVTETDGRFCLKR